MSEPRDIVVERISYRVFAIRGGKLLKTWAKVGTKLKPVTATTLQRLKAKLKKISIDLLNGNVEAADLEPGDHRAYIAARQIAQRMGMSVEAVTREYAAAWELLGSSGSVLEAARFFQQHNQLERKGATLNDLIDLFFGVKTKLSGAYRDVFQMDMKRLQDLHGARPIADIPTEDLEKFIAGAGMKVRGEFKAASDFRRKQIRGELITLFNFARRRKFLPPKLDTAAHRLEKIDAIAIKRRVWDPEHLRRAMEVVWADEPEWLPWLSISALANFRSVPIRRLHWEHMHWNESLLELQPEDSKVGEGVTVDVRPALMSWLNVARYRGLKGPMFPRMRIDGLTNRLRAKYGLPYYKNVLRRSFITYLLAETDDEEYVALVANTSVKKVRANYRKVWTFANRLVTKELAAAWFSTGRIAADNVVQLEFSA